MKNKTLAIILWDDCNFKCEHCLIECDQKGGNSLKDNEIKELIKSASEFFKSDWKLSLSSGEAFLYFDRLLEIVKSAHLNKA